MGDLIFLEILLGIRNDSDYRLTKQTLMTLGRFELFGEGKPEKCAENYRAPAKKEPPSEKQLTTLLRLSTSNDECRCYLLIGTSFRSLTTLVRSLHCRKHNVEAKRRGFAAIVGVRGA